MASTSQDRMVSPLGLRGSRLCHARRLRRQRPSGTPKLTLHPPPDHLQTHVRPPPPLPLYVSHTHHNQGTSNPCPLSTPPQPLSSPTSPKPPPFCHSTPPLSQPPSETSNSASVPPTSSQNSTFPTTNSPPKAPCPSSPAPPVSPCPITPGPPCAISSSLRQVSTLSASGSTLGISGLGINGSRRRDCLDGCSMSGLPGGRGLFWLCPSCPRGFGTRGRGFGRLGWGGVIFWKRQRGRRHRLGWRGGRDRIIGEYSMCI